MRARIALLAALLLIPLLAPAHAGEPSLRVCPTGRQSFEPNLAIAVNGTFFVTATTRDEIPAFGNLYRDQVLATGDPCGAWGDVTPKAAGVTLPPYTFDPDLAMDPSTGRVFLADLEFLACPTLSWTDDGGASWVTDPVGCGQGDLVQDHQTVFAGPPRAGGLPPVGYAGVVYTCAALLFGSGCASSLDGGITFGPMVPVWLATGASCQDSLTGQGVVAPDGTAYVGRGQCGVPMIARSEDEGLSWQTFTISASVGSPDHEVSVGVDGEGRAYAFWIDPSGQPTLSASADHGETWTPARALPVPGLGQAALPSLVATGAGKVALAFVATTADAPLSWHAYLAEGNLSAAGEPSFDMAASAGEIASGACQVTGKWCDMGDFVDVDFDPSGHAWGAFVDAEHGTAGFVATLQ